MGQEVARVLRRMRDREELSQGELAKLAGCTRTAVSKWENGATPGEHVVQALDRELRAGGALVAARRADVAALRAAVSGVTCGTIDSGTAKGRPEAVSRTERRELMMAAGYGAVGSLVGPHSLTEARTAGSVSPEWLAAIEAQTQAIAHQVWRVADQRPLFAPAMERYTAITSLLKAPQRTADRRRLMRAGANIAGSIGVMVGEAGDLRSASSWKWTCHGAALDAGDHYLADMALVAMAHDCLFDERPADVLAVLEPRLGRPIARPNQGTAKVYGAAARAHAKLGDRAACRRYLEAERDAFERAPDPTIQAWNWVDAAQLDYHEATAAASLGESARVIEAADRAIDGLDPSDSGDRVLVLFDKATALYRLGDVGEACRLATGAIRDRRALVDGTSLRARAAAFDAVLGKPTSGPVADWREVYQARRARELTI